MVVVTTVSVGIGLREDVSAATTIVIDIDLHKIK
jgi:hypothetical protein